MIYVMKMIKNHKNQRNHMNHSSDNLHHSSDCFVLFIFKSVKFQAHTTEINKLFNFQVISFEVINGLCKMNKSSFISAFISTLIFPSTKNQLCVSLRVNFCKILAFHIHVRKKGPAIPFHMPKPVDK
jgi:hypothetical protein